jgi:hypothetical protein
MPWWELIAGDLCVRLQEGCLEHFLHEPGENDGALDSKIVKTAVHKAFFEMIMVEKRQQDKDQNAFTALAGAGVVAGNPDFQMAEAGGRERASTGPLVVGGDVLSLTSTFLRWEKVKPLREWKAPGGRTVRSCHVSPCSTMVLTSSGHDLQLRDAASGMLKRTSTGHTKIVRSCRFFSDLGRPS